jgi:hypothetical protein
MWLVLAELLSLIHTMGKTRLGLRQEHDVVCTRMSDSSGVCLFWQQFVKKLRKRERRQRRESRLTKYLYPGAMKVGFIQFQRLRKDPVKHRQYFRRRTASATKPSCLLF